MITREQALNAGRELSDLVGLVIDQVPNSQQLGDFFKEGTEASRTIIGIARTEIPEGKKPAVGTNIVEGFLNGMNTRVEQFILPSAAQS